MSTPASNHLGADQVTRLASAQPAPDDSQDARRWEPPQQCGEVQVPGGALTEHAQRVATGVEDDEALTSGHELLGNPLRAPPLDGGRPVHATEPVEVLRIVGHQVVRLLQAAAGRCGGWVAVLSTTVQP